jgi:predicted hydrocarbon binding protein
LTIHGVLFSKFDVKKGPMVQEVYPDDFKDNFSNQELAKIALQSMGLYDTSKESFNVFIIKEEIIGVSFVIKLIGPDFDRGMSMISFTIILSDLNPLAFKMKLVQTVKQVAKNIRNIANQKESITGYLMELYEKAMEIALSSSEYNAIEFNEEIYSQIVGKYQDIVSHFYKKPIEAIEQLRSKEIINRVLLYHLGYAAAEKKWMADHLQFLKMGAKIEFDFSLIMKQELVPLCRIFGKVEKGSSHSISIYENIVVRNGYNCAVIEGYIAGIMRMILEHSDNEQAGFVIRETICSNDGFEYCDFVISVYDQ